MEKLIDYLECLSPDAKIELVSGGVIFSGYAGEAQNLPYFLLERYDVVGTMFEGGILAIYIC